MTTLKGTLDDLSLLERKLLLAVAQRSGWILFKIEKRSFKMFDIHVQGKVKDGKDFFDWLPLSAIRLVNWRQYADLSDYPMLVMRGDFTGIRDSEEERVWEMTASAVAQILAPES